MYVPIRTQCDNVDDDDDNYDKNDDDDDDDHTAADDDDDYYYCEWYGTRFLIFVWYILRDEFETLHLTHDANEMKTEICFCHPAIHVSALFGAEN